ncbi:MAG: chitobiase/beta-hexosaminidase C-terminal domain-containing protein [Crocinitomicaceae bacterium]
MQYLLRLLVCSIFFFLSNELSAQLELSFSKERGFSDASFSLTLTTTDPSAVIRYTLNGDEPSTTNGTIYSGSIPVNTTSVVRAIGYIDGVDTTDLETHTYLFLNDVIQQSENIAGWPNNFYNLGGGGTAQHDYGMDPNIVNSPAYAGEIVQGLKDIPSMSIVMPKTNFWNMYDGSSEEKTSIELLYANDSTLNEQVDGGIEPHSHNRLKRSMRLSFKQSYGPSKWKTDIFRNAVLADENATDRLDRIVLRSGNNRAWTRNWNEDRTAFTRDEWFRQSQIASSGIGSHGEFVHLYVNGLYWGIYNPVERLDESFTSTYFGGTKDDWFAVSHGGNQGGDATRYDYLMNTIVNNNLTTATNYDELKEYLNVPKFCDYVILSWMTGVQDWPGNNWWGGNKNLPGEPFMYFGWDNEWSWDVSNNANNGAWVHPAFESTDQNGQNSARVFNRSKVNQDFMMKFADRVYKLCFNNGPMTDDNSRLRWSTLNGNIQSAVIAESARWGDGLDDGVTRTRDVHWQNEVDRLDSLMNGNVQRLMNALYAEGYYPTVDPPLFENNGTAIEVQEISVPNNYQLDLVNPNNGGDIYYSVDGVDPRLEGGAISPTAINYTGGNIGINQAILLMARVKDGNDWSALHCMKLFIANDFDSLKLTEIMYHPPDVGGTSGSELEFLEIKNTSVASTIDLSGVQIINGVDFTFPLGTLIAPQSFIILASNATDLGFKCPGVPIFGEYGGQLNNGGEMIEFMSVEGDTIIRVEYDDVAPWEELADGDGYSLVSSNWNPVGDQNGAVYWLLSDDFVCGSPGEDDPNFVGIDVLDGPSQTVIYPNPGATDDLLTIQAHNIISSVEVFTVQGKSIKTEIKAHDNYELVIGSPKVAGFYVLRIYFENGTTESKRFVLE